MHSINNVPYVKDKTLIFACKKYDSEPALPTTSLTIKMPKQASLGQFLKSTTNERAVPSTSAEGSKRQAPEELG